MTYRFDTLALHAGQVPDQDTLSRAVPLYLTTSYLFRDADHAADLFALRQPGNIYTRMMNPTTDVLEKRLAALHGATAAVATASGQAAAFLLAATLAAAGDNFVAGNRLYGGTHTLFGNALKRFGIECRFVDASDPDAFVARTDDRTRFYYVESVSNPSGEIADYAAIADRAHARGLPFAVDNTFTPPPIFNPLDHGADLVSYSLTKMIGGHGTAIGGAVVEKGTFDWKAAGRFPEITEPDPAYHGVNFWEVFGPGGPGAAEAPSGAGAAFSAKLRTCWMRDLGACLSPFNAWLFIQGLETLPLRAARHCESAGKLAEWLSTHPAVAWVEYAGLSTHRDYERCHRYLPMGPGAVFAFGLKGGYEAGKRFIAAVKLASHLANVLDAKTLVIHPASTTHQQLTEAEQRHAGIGAEMIRLSVGLEDVADIRADLDQALRAADA